MSVTITGLLAIILATAFSPEDAETIGAFLNQAVLVGGILLTYWGRYRQGDITIFGTRK